MKTHFYLKAGDKRLLGDVFRSAIYPSDKWKFVSTWGDIVTESELKEWLYFRPSREWVDLHMQPNLIDVYDEMVRKEHPHVPYYNDDPGHWEFPYLLKGEQGWGGGVGCASFKTLREAVLEALKLKPLD